MKGKEGPNIDINPGPLDIDRVPPDIDPLDHPMSDHNKFSISNNRLDRKNIEPKKSKISCPTYYFSVLVP